MSHSNDRSGAIFLGVCRGKLSEGISLADNGCRCVIIVGIPYQQKYEQGVLLKQHYLDNKIDANKDDR